MEEDDEILKGTVARENVEKFTYKLFPFKARPVDENGQQSNKRNSNLELLRILCMLGIIATHLAGQSGLLTFDTLENKLFYVFFTNFDRMSCGVFVMIGAWFMVDGVFHVRRIFHIWLTVFFNAVPLMIFTSNFTAVDLSWKRIVSSMLPVASCPLWFAGYYILLVMFSPALNLYLHRASQGAQRYILCVFGVWLVLIPTITRQPGILCHEMLEFIFIYLLIGYLKHWPILPLENRRLTVLVFFGIVTLVVTLRFVGTMEIGLAEVIASYGEWYRAQFQTVPNLVGALCVFYYVKNSPPFYSKTINRIAALTLGCYVVHQTPGFRDYLWNGIFHCQSYVGTDKQIPYTIFVWLAVYIFGTVLEAVRAYWCLQLFEKRMWYQKLCNRFDEQIKIRFCGEKLITEDFR